MNLHETCRRRGSNPHSRREHDFESCASASSATPALLVCYSICYSYAMRRNNGVSEHAGRFVAVFDSRKRKIRGLRKRGTLYYAQMRMDTGDGRTKPKRIPLDAKTLDEATAELERTRTENRAGQLALPRRHPSFAEFADEYLGSATHAQKRPSTRRAERVILGYWKTHLGGVRLGKITPVIVKSYREKRLSQGVTARTVNIETVTFYAVLKDRRRRSDGDRQ